MISFKSLIVTGSLSLLTLAAWADPPKVIERWIHNEQKVNFTGSGPNPAMNYEFTPEAGQIFNIEGVWVDADQVEVSFDKESAPEFLEKKFFRIKDGKKQVLFVYHLQTPEYYHGLTQGRKADVKLPVTPSASVRSLFTWDDKPQQEAFFTKLSINLVLGANRRLIPAAELSRSLYFTKLFRLIKKDLPASFVYLPEVLGILPKGQKEGGTLIRTIPPEVLRGERQLIPYFSLYSPDATAPDQKPLVVQMIDQSGRPAKEFIRKHLLDDFIVEWLSLAIDHGITMEPHGQNLMIETDSKGRLTGRYVHRDFGGFSVDRDYRRKLGLPDVAEKDIPHFAGIFDAGDNDYGLKTSFTRFFVNILDNLDWRYSEWQRNGWVEDMKGENFREIFLKDLESLYEAKTGLKLKMNGDFEKIMEGVHQARKKRLAVRSQKSLAPASSMSCRKIFRY